MNMSMLRYKMPSLKYCELGGQLRQRGQEQRGRGGSRRGSRLIALATTARSNSSSTTTTPAAAGTMVSSSSSTTTAASFPATISYRSSTTTTTTSRLMLDPELAGGARPVVGGTLVGNGLVYREHFLVRTFDIGPDWKITMTALMNYFQEAAISHYASMGIVAEGFGLTEYMSRNNLGWVIPSVQVVVYRYPSWGEVFQLDKMIYESGKTGLNHDYLIRDGKTGEVLVRASNVYVMMNKGSRKISKFVKEVRDELAPHLSPVPNIPPVIGLQDDRKIQSVDIESADNICTGLTPGLYDLDINYHVNNIKYVDWVIKGVPGWILESRELCGMKLQYKKECRIADGSLLSLSKIGGNDGGGDFVELDHLIRLEDGSEITRARTTWRLKSSNATAVASRFQSI